MDAPRPTRLLMLLFGLSVLALPWMVFTFTAIMMLPALGLGPVATRIAALPTIVAAFASYGYVAGRLFGPALWGRQDR